MTSEDNDFHPIDLRCWCGGAVVSSGDHIGGRLVMYCAADPHHNWRAEGQE